MDPLEINKKFIELLKKEFPKKNELVNALGDILPTDKRTLYRRINNEVPFTLPEFYLIAKYFHLSIDSLFYYNNYPLPSKPVIIDNLYNFYSTDSVNQDEPYYYEMISTINQQSYSEQCRILHMPSIAQLMQHPYLAATISLYYSYRNGNKVDFENFRVKDLDKHNEKMLRIAHIIQGCDYTYVILGPYMGKNVEIIVKYLEKLGVINRTIVEEIKKELYQIVDYDKEITVSGKYPLTGKKCDIYISNAPVDINYGYVWSEEYYVSVFEIYSMELSISEDLDTFQRMKKWIDTQKRNSVLITNTGESERVDFFRKQEQIIDTL